ncbi:hypothetical protein H5410_006904 [Solanum commersonii]|uniref:Uncharacterized protein n=1 Tax=Solanum commersonii TaxID=4109 RepID=A0A9J6AAF3_SOLCO|nr:hypothetical protein H5410_006904 [Solanum commersonii]
MNRFIDGHNPIDRLKRKVKKLEEERDSLKFQLNENEEKMMVLNKKLKEVKLQRDWDNVKFNRVVIVIIHTLFTNVNINTLTTKVNDLTFHTSQSTTSPSPPKLTNLTLFTKVNINTFTTNIS